MSRYHHAVSFVADLDTTLFNNIRRLDCVRDVTYNARLKETTVYPTQGLFIFDEVSHFLRQQGIQVSSLKMEAGRLEEVFRNITQTGGHREVNRLNTYLPLLNVNYIATLQPPSPTYLLLYF